MEECAENAHTIKFAPAAFVRARWHYPHARAHYEYVLCCRCWIKLHAPLHSAPRPPFVRPGPCPIVANTGATHAQSHSLAHSHTRPAEKTIYLNACAEILYAVCRNRHQRK